MMSENNLPSFAKKIRDFSSPHAFIVCGAYSGLSPFASGTTGSAAALVTWYLLAEVGIIPSILSQCVAVILVTALGLYSTDRFLKSELNQRTLSRKQGDPGVVVIDEWSGMMITMVNGINDSLPYLLLAFFFFRLFDVLKPGPVNSLQNLPGTWGVMLDDVGAGFLALAVMQLIKMFYFS